MPGEEVLAVTGVPEDEDDPWLHGYDRRAQLSFNPAPQLTVAVKFLEGGTLRYESIAELADMAYGCLGSACAQLR